MADRKYAITEAQIRELAAAHDPELLFTDTHVAFRERSRVVWWRALLAALLGLAVLAATPFACGAGAALLIRGYEVVR